MAYQVLIQNDAIDDIQEAIEYYDSQQAGLGSKFEQALNKLFILLEKTPRFAIRYDNVHCVPLKKYPFMIHYTIEDSKQIIEIRGCFHTSKNTDKWKR
jgi:toxin ParE1/3/4